MALRALGRELTGRLRDRFRAPSARPARQRERAVAAARDLVEQLGRLKGAFAKAGQFATFFYGILDLAESTFTFSNAGHCPALLLKHDYTDRLGEGGMPLGVRPLGAMARSWQT